MNTQTELKTPSSIILACREDSHPVAGLLAMVTLETERKNPFHVFVGPTDSRGYASITRKEILESIKRDAQTFQMDYAGPESLTGGIQVMVLDTDRIQAALRAFELYSKHIPYPKDYAITLRTALIRAMEVDTKRISVTVERQMERMRGCAWRNVVCLYRDRDRPRTITFGTRRIAAGSTLNVDSAAIFLADSGSQIS